MVTFPSKIVPTARTDSTCVVTFVPVSLPVLASATCSVTGQVLTVKNIFSGDYTASTTVVHEITITVTDIMNSDLTRPSASFHVQSKYSLWGIRFWF